MYPVPAESFHRCHLRDVGTPERFDACDNPDHDPFSWLVRRQPLSRTRGDEYIVPGNSGMPLAQHKVHARNQLGGVLPSRVLVLVAEAAKHAAGAPTFERAICTLKSDQASKLYSVVACHYDVDKGSRLMHPNNRHKARLHQSFTHTSTEG